MLSSQLEFSQFELQNANEMVKKNSSLADHLEENPGDYHTETVAIYQLNEAYEAVFKEARKLWRETVLKITYYYKKFYEIPPARTTTATTTTYLTVSSTGGANETQPESMGVYNKTSQTWSGRPVWQSTVTADRFFYYDGNNFPLII